MIVILFNCEFFNKNFMLAWAPLKFSCHTALLGRSAVEYGRTRSLGFYCAMTPSRELLDLWIEMAGG